ncbi:MAG: FAD-dependent oxidoreductase, partial [Bacteroidales bacterium]|nr:FAD-dependent oxidoreductase [Bacteroidales bacterium]
MDRRVFLKGSAASVAALALTGGVTSCGRGNVVSVKGLPGVQKAGDFDVVVCGGGPAGFISAIAASRQGKRVALIERYGF